MSIRNPNASAEKVRYLVKNSPSPLEIKILKMFDNIGGFLAITF
jgi:hypothetical protein